MTIDLLKEKKYWQQTPDDILLELHTGISGLHENEILQRQKQHGLNIIHQRKINFLTIFFRQFTSNPLIVILAAATFISYLLGQQISAIYIFFMILLSVTLGLWNEYSAVRTVDALLKKISPTALVERNGEKLEVPVSHLTIGDIVLLSQGSIIPADVRLIEAKNLEVNQSVLTGEAKTIFKTHEGIQEEPKSATNIDNVGYMGTTVESG